MDSYQTGAPDPLRIFRVQSLIEEPVVEAGMVQGQYGFRPGFLADGDLFLCIQEYPQRQKTTQVAGCAKQLS